MLDFETAKALKASGFPQTIPDEFGDEQSRWWMTGGSNPVICCWLQSDEFNDDDTYGEDQEPVLCKCPSIEDLLRELLRANPWELNLNAEWQNLFPGGEYEWEATMRETCASGSTPELALANLYLSLHKAK